ncbi:hypothetical protein C0993_011795 [Termitomyces sp. T159_Od127]|nr:hypothetical protein C0993_011795 [Termitomyces sp. T159_Od127]
MASPSRSSSGSQISILSTTVTNSSDSPSLSQTQSSPLSSTQVAMSIGPVIGGTIGGIVFVTFVAITTFITIKRRIRRQAQAAQLPTVNSLLQSSRAFELASEQNLPSTKAPLDSVSGTQTPSTPPPSLTATALESTIQHQMDSMARRIMALEAHLEDVSAPPDYASQATD